MERSSSPAFETSDRQPPHRGIGYLLAALSAVLFAMKGVLIKLAYDPGTNGAIDVDAITLLTLRMGFAAPAYIIVGALAWRRRARQGQPPPEPRAVLMAGLLGVLGYHMSSYLDFEGLVYLTAQFERLILLTYPAFVLLFGALFFNTPVAWSSMTGLAVAYAGIAAIFSHGAAGKGDHTTLGVFLVLTAAVSFALYQLLAKSLLKRIDAAIFTSITMMAASVAVLIHFCVVKDASTLLETPWRVIWLAAVMGVLSTVAPTFMMNSALHRVGPQAVSAIGSIGPVVTIGMAVAFVGEPFTVVDAFGSALVISGVSWFSWRDFNARK
jgi:drug/metabolite transporter (DMT)-like permease